MKGRTGDPDPQQVEMAIGEAPNGRLQPGTTRPINWPRMAMMANRPGRAEPPAPRRDRGA
ncbi:hypothetical protein CCS01_10385 [Rhodopila globiformis]|uniref:Uncharacterized protein n=1 Tax=Rhodopila globiformis TaxID=1071 RepID=A0A2S6NIU8_RHOGL|nr:hypothetical protein CCS01_10385 [Rhodopila globiformis]